MASPSNQTLINPFPAPRRGWLLFLLFVWFAPFGDRGLLAQTFPLQIQVSVMPPYSAYLQDYPGTGQQVRVFLINTSQQTFQVRLTGQLTGDNGIDIRTSAGYRPLRPVTVPPGQTLLSRTDLEGLFDLRQVEVTGIDKNQLARGLPLPDGTYQLCVRAFNETPTNTAAVRFGQPLSPEFPLGCSAPIVVRAVEPPILISPLCDAEVTVTTPQTVVFTWTPPAGVSPAQVDYTLRIVELPQVDVDPNVFIDAVALPRSGVEVRNLRTSTFLYGPAQPPLVVGKRYAWRVQAFDRSRKLNFLNDGKAPVCAFTYGTLPTVVADTGRRSEVLVENRRTPVSGLGELIFAGQTITIRKVTNPDQDHFSGQGTITIAPPVGLNADIDFSDLVVRPTETGLPGKRGKGSVNRYVVVRGKLEASLKGAKSVGLTLKLKTHPHTGGTAAVTYESLRLLTDHTATLDPKLNTYVLDKGGTDEAAIQTGLVWNSPITITTTGGVANPGKNGKFATGFMYTHDGNMVVEVPGQWQPLASAGQKASSEPLKVIFGKAYGGKMADLPGFQLAIREDSYFEIQNNVLQARLNGSLLVAGGKQDVPDLTISFQNSDGITFQQQIDAPQIPLGVVDDQARLFLSFEQVNVQLGDLFEADDLPYPQWVKGMSCPVVDLWAGRMVYKQDAFHPTSQDHLDWMPIPLNPVVNRGKGYESTVAARDDLNIQSPYLGYKGKITTAVAFIKNSEFKMGHVAGEVYIPFVGAVGQLQIGIEKYGLGDADVFFSKPTERTLLQTPDGDQVTLKVTGGYFENAYFHPDMWISAYNPTNATRGIDARDIHLDGVDVAITPGGELVSDYVGKDAGASFGGSKQKTAYLNGLDYHLARVVLGDEPGGKKARLSFNGKLVLGDKIVTDNEYLYTIVFAKPDKDAFDFDGTIPYTPIENVPKLPKGSGTGLPKPGNGPYGNSYDDEAEADLLATAVGYSLERQAPATALMPLAAKTVGGSFSTGTAAYTGQFTLFTDDATYGNGFRLDVGMQVYKPTNVLTKATVIAGKTQGVKYWFAGFKYESKDTPGIPLFLNLEGYGFEGRIYSHMKHVGNPTEIFNDNYVPDPGTTFGLFAAMPIQSKADKGVLLWGKTGVEMVFQGFVPKTITIRGDVNMEQVGGTGDATTSRLQGNAVIVLAPEEKTLMGTVTLTKGDFGVACVTGSAYLYLGPSGFATSVGSPAGPVQVNAMCGMMGDFTPSANGHIAFYATNGSIGGMNWIPTSGIGVFAHLGVTLLDLNTKDHFDTNPWASVYAGADADLGVTIRPALDLKARIGTQISLNVGYNNYAYNLANVTETIQLTLPNFCLAYNKRICFPVLGGCNLIVGLSPGPYMRTNGAASDMCYDDGSVQGPCEGLLGWLMDGVQVVIDAVGQVLDTAGNLIRDAAGAVVELAGDVWNALTSWW